MLINTGFFVCQGCVAWVCRFCTLALPLCRVLFSLATPTIYLLCWFLINLAYPKDVFFVIYPIKKILTYCLKLLIIKYSKAMYALFVYILSRFQCLHFCMPNKPLWAWLGYRELQKHFWDWFFVKLKLKQWQRLRSGVLDRFFLCSISYIIFCCYCIGYRVVVCFRYFSILSASPSLLKGGCKQKK